MKGLKKIIVALVFVTMLLPSFALAENEVVKLNQDMQSDGKIAKELGIIVGDGRTSFEDYLKDKPTRMQAAIMYLRLNGLESTAKAYQGSQNFADTKTMTWMDGKNIMSYLKANPELGWVGDGVNFKPNDQITAQQYYKVLLEALGYKCDNKGNKDFTFDNTIEFAKINGLQKISDKSKLTNQDLAIATIESLKAKKKDGEIMINALIDAGVVDKKKAEELSLIRKEETKPIIAEKLDKKEDFNTDKDRDKKSSTNSSNNTTTPQAISISSFITSVEATTTSSIKINITSNNGIESIDKDKIKFAQNTNTKLPIVNLKVIEAVKDGDTSITLILNSNLDERAWYPGADANLCIYFEERAMIFTNSNYSQELAIDKAFNVIDRINP